MVKIESSFWEGTQISSEKNSNSEFQKCISEIQALMALINDKRRLDEAKAAEQEAQDK